MVLPRLHQQQDQYTVHLLLLHLLHMVLHPVVEEAEVVGEVEDMVAPRLYQHQHIVHQLQLQGQYTVLLLQHQLLLTVPHPVEADLLEEDLVELISEVVEEEVMEEEAAEAPMQVVEEVMVVDHLEDMADPVEVKGEGEEVEDLEVEVMVDQVEVDPVEDMPQHHSTVPQLQLHSIVPQLQHHSMVRQHKICTAKFPVINSVIKFD